MIEIIKHGNLRRGAICDKCGCEFYYNNTDLQNREKIGEVIWYDVRCPDCNNCIRVKWIK